MTLIDLYLISLKSGGLFGPSLDTNNDNGGGSAT